MEAQNKRLGSHVSLVADPRQVRSGGDWWLAVRQRALLVAAMFARVLKAYSLNSTKEFLVVTQIAHWCHPFGSGLWNSSARVDMGDGHLAVSPRMISSGKANL